MSAAGRSARTDPSPTRSGPEGSSRNDFRSGSCPVSHPRRMARFFVGGAQTAARPLRGLGFPSLTLRRPQWPSYEVSGGCPLGLNRERFGYPGDRMGIHRNARQTPAGREVLVRRVLDQGHTPMAVATAMGVCVSTVRKWVPRFRAGGVAGLLQDRSSRPHRSPRRTPAPIAARIAASSTSAPGPTHRRPTARPNASSRRRCGNGPTPKPTKPQTSAPTRCRNGCTATTGTGLMLA